MSITTISPKVSNMKSSSGRNVPNQFLMEEKGGIGGNFIKRETFQSYDSVIAVRTVWQDETCIELDEKYWDYSTTTGKYRNRFLGENKKETEKKIKSGAYKLNNLN